MSQCNSVFLFMREKEKLIALLQSRVYYCCYEVECCFFTYSVSDLTHIKAYDARAAAATKKKAEKVELLLLLLFSEYWVS